LEVLRRCEHIVTIFCKGAIAFFFIVLIVAAALQVVSRFVFNSPISWTDEVCIFSMVWMGMIGAAYAVRTGSHIKVDLLPNSIGPQAARMLYRVLLLFVLLFAFVMLRYGSALVAGNMRQISAALKVPMGYIYLCFPLSGILMLYYTILEFLGKSEA